MIGRMLNNQVINFTRFYAIGGVGIYLLLLCCSVSAAESSSIAQQRAAFLKAEQAFKEGDQARFSQLTKQLRDYPLYPYLRYEDLSTRLDSAKTREIDTFLDTFADSPVASRLRYEWLQELASHRRWRTYLHAYRPSNSFQLQCYHRQALWATGDHKAALSDMEALWLNGQSLPDACDPLLESWRKAGGLTEQLVWQRIRLAMADGEPKLARYLARFLPPHEQQWVQVWYKVHRKPSLILHSKLLDGNHPAAKWIFVHGMKRLARIDTEKAVEAWGRLSGRFHLSDDERGDIIRAIGLSLAYDGHQDARGWLAKIPATHTDQAVRYWRVRAALVRQDWPEVLHWIARLTKGEQSDDRWQYWRARALEALGNRDEAKALYRHLATSRSYEGFLAADRLGLPYRFEEESLRYEPAELATLEKLPGILRARELFHLGRDLDARREWYAATRHMDESELRRAAKLAHAWGWHDRAILTLGRSSYRDDLELRFPVVHETTVVKQANKANVDPAWAFAVIRRESAFNPEARSYRGARGLMQLLPATARQVARVINAPFRGSAELYKADLNIQLGINYLRMVLDKFSDHPVLATAAYNAGGYRVRGWLPQNQPLPADIWIETIPFNETRNYLRSVLAYTAIYERRMGREPTPLKNRMPPVSPEPSGTKAALTTASQDSS
jgi:soluble lytic murein transglycosylase